MTCKQIFLGSGGKGKQKEERRRLNSSELQPAICDFKGSKPTASRVELQVVIRNFKAVAGGWDGC